MTEHPVFALTSLQVRNNARILIAERSPSGIKLQLLGIGGSEHVAQVFGF